MRKSLSIVSFFLLVNILLAVPSSKVPPSSIAGKTNEAPPSVFGPKNGDDNFINVGSNNNAGHGQAVFLRQPQRLRWISIDLPANLLQQQEPIRDGTGDDTVTNKNQSFKGKKGSRVKRFLLISSDDVNGRLPVGDVVVPEKFAGPTTSTENNILGTMPSIICDLYVVGTAHVCKQSSEDVEYVMDAVNPDCLFLELCAQRIRVLEPPEQQQQSGPPSLSMRESYRALRAQGMSSTGAISATLLSNIQDDYGAKMGIAVGEEFRVAYEWARRSNALRRRSGSSLPCRVILGDRPVMLTLIRAWESLSFFGKLRLIVALLWSSFRRPSEEEVKKWIEKVMENSDFLTASIEKLSRSFPSVRRVLIDERDMYMAAKLQQAAECASKFNIRRIVAVVGAGHCPGIGKIMVENSGASTKQKLESILRTEKWAATQDEVILPLITHFSEIEA